MYKLFLLTLIPKSRDAIASKNKNIAPGFSLRLDQNQKYFYLIHVDVNPSNQNPQIAVFISGTSYHDKSFRLSINLLS